MWKSFPQPKTRAVISSKSTSSWHFENYYSSKVAVKNSSQELIVERLVG